MTAGRPPSLRLERELGLDAGALVAGMDEVGRGALAGPVSVGVCVVGPLTRRQPAGLRDSKLVVATARERLCAPIRRWATACAVGHASPDEIDAVGIIAALRLAGRRALAQVTREVGRAPAVVLLDGNHDWLSTPRDLFAAADLDGDLDADVEEAPPVHLRIKADLTCASVAAASVLAKVERDALMRAAHERDGRFDWVANKGYAAASHLAALTQHGPSVEHRRSWRLPGVGDARAREGMMVP
ncbi:ribonuclease HII [Litorihabitans aurantiacus]|uniref:Ribonuclease n=1 Tax=Litorihabitans aurantiacus TaxID=1930061 RepID=A0AA37XEM5_9MICO|nr:ribonuclease HII [Litorihabitans aurantiacus]GMA31816.1 ribonuclease HII [Litorihabitans aurantiacus]